MILSKKKLSNLTKVETLEDIHSNKILEKNISIPKIYFFNKGKYLKNKKFIINEIKKKFKAKFIIRSSSLSEDNVNYTNAGKFDSFVIQNFFDNEVRHKIDIIISKFKNKNDQIFIQDYIDNVDLSGVIFTREPSSNSPYYVINYDKSGFTNKITSGSYEKTAKTSITSKNKFYLNKKFIKLINLAQKLENFYDCESLDIEFAKKGEKWFLFQCRKLPIRKPQIKDSAIFSSLTNISKKIIKIKKILPKLHGSTTYLSNMSDWNPAEMIGVKPKPLAISLYAELITNKVWSQQRKDYHYKDVSPNILMHNLGGSPYIDLRTDFNSFLPRKLNEKLSKKYINMYLNKIKKNKNLHDKIEFNLIPTCYDLNLIDRNIYAKSYINELKFLTNNLINNGSKILEDEIKKNKLLDLEINKIENSNLSHIQKIFFLVEETKKNGTLPFAGIARLAFITTKILYSIKDIKLLDEYELQSIFNSVNSITKYINHDLKKLKKKKITKKIFFKKYGHVRPSTYSITSKNFIEGYDLYFSNIKPIKLKPHKKELIFKNEKKINTLFKKENISISFKQFISFFKKTVEAREQSKFHFTKGVDRIFTNLIKLGNEVSLKRDDLEYLDIGFILYAYNNLSMIKLKNTLNKNIKSEKISYSILSKVKLPDFISVPNDVYNFEILNAKGNYIGSEKILGKVEYISSLKKIAKLKNKIIFIENADPGYDFIFAHNIKGLVTKYGGANSHMALRCLELKIPAIIGIGINEFEYYKNQNSVEIDCIQKKIKFV